MDAVPQLVTSSRCLSTRPHAWPSTGSVGELGELAASGKLHVPVTRTFALADANEALAAQASRRSTGKLVIVIE